MQLCNHIEHSTEFEMNVLLVFVTCTLHNTTCPRWTSAQAQRQSSRIKNKHTDACIFKRWRQFNVHRTQRIVNFSTTVHTKVQQQMGMCITLYIPVLITWCVCVCWNNEKSSYFLLSVCIFPHSFLFFHL